MSFALDKIRLQVEYQSGPLNDTYKKGVTSIMANNVEKTIILKMGEQTIHSIKELQEHYDPEILLQYHITGDLVLWLEQHFYEKEAEEVSKIKIDEPGCLSQLCSKLGIVYEKTLSDEEQNALNLKKEKLKQLTDNEEIISHPELAAFHQGELVELLQRGLKRIYLCKEEFSLPIKVPNIEYIGIGNATIRNPYTKEQYNKVNIKITGMNLVDKGDSVTDSIAKESATANGYDDFQDQHTQLAGLFHKELNIERKPVIYRLPLDLQKATREYSSKYDCKKAIDSIIQKAYDKAGNYLTVGNSCSISKEMATFYSEHIHKTFDPHMVRLQQIASISKTQFAYDELKVLIQDSYKSLLNVFEQELLDSNDYYRLYKKQYFIDLVDINEYDARTCDTGIWGGLEKLLTDKIKYRMSPEISSSVQEMQKDLNDHCTTFFHAAHEEYYNYISEIEKKLDIIGLALPNPSQDENINRYLIRSCTTLVI